MATPDTSSPTVKDTTPQELALLEQIDSLAYSMSNGNLEFGWAALDYWALVKQDQVKAFGSEKKAYNELITFLWQREAKEIPARNTVTDHLRMARYFPREAYNAIKEETGVAPTYHQLRNCLVVKGQKLVQDDTNKRIEWCISNNWPPVADIRAHFAKDKIPGDPIADHWSKFVKLAQIIIGETGPESLHNQAANVVFAVFKKENGLN